jgi:hypothetical protein
MVSPKIKETSHLYLRTTKLPIIMQIIVIITVTLPPLKSMTQIIKIIQKMLYQTICSPRIRISHPLEIKITRIICSIIKIVATTSPTNSGENLLKPVTDPVIKPNNSLNQGNNLGQTNQVKTTTNQNNASNQNNA